MDDPALSREALARPGEIIRKLRGSPDEHMAELGKAVAKLGEKAKSKSQKTARPRPSRNAVDAAEEAVAALRDEQAVELTELHQNEEALARERRALELRHERALAPLERKRDQAADHYEQALDRWHAE